MHESAAAALPPPAAPKSWPYLAVILGGGAPYLVTLTLALLAPAFRFGDPLGILGLSFLSYGFAFLLIAPALFSMLFEIMRKDVASNKWMRAGFIAGCLILASPLLIGGLWSLLRP